MKTLITLLLFIISSIFLLSQSNDFQLLNTGFSGAITAVAEDTSGNIWVAVWSGSDNDSTNEVVLISDQVIDTILIHSRFPIWGIDVDQQNNLWIATQDTGLIKYDGNDFEYFNIRQIITRTPNHNNANCVQVDSENNIWIGAIGGLAKYDGSNWFVFDDLNSPLQFLPDIFSIKFDSQNYIWFTDYFGAGRFDGVNWTFWDSVPFQYLSTVALEVNGTAWFGSQQGWAIELSNDSTWNELDFLLIPDSPYQIAIDTNNIKWFGKFDPNENILAYNGLNFQQLVIPFTEVQNSSLNSIYSDKQNNKCFGFNNGYLVKYSGDFPTNINDDFENIPNQFALFQNYPNPFNPSTKISWQSPVGSWQTLKVYDVLGKEVETLVDEFRNAGSYEIEFSTVSGPESSIKNPVSGVYFYQLKAGSFVQTKKMLMIK